MGGVCHNLGAVAPNLGVYCNNLGVYCHNLGVFAPNLGVLCQKRANLPKWSQCIWDYSFFFGRSLVKNVRVLPNIFESSQVFRLLPDLQGHLAFFYGSRGQKPKVGSNQTIIGRIVSRVGSNQTTFGSNQTTFGRIVYKKKKNFNSSQVVFDYSHQMTLSSQIYHQNWEQLKLIWEDTVYSWEQSKQIWEQSSHIWEDCVIFGSNQTTFGSIL